MSFFPGFRPEALRFLRQLKRNNRREWFQEHRERYEQEVRTPMKLFVEEMDVRLAEFAPEIIGDAKRGIFRIHRDVRFSRDKSPYKTHAACWLMHRNAGHGVGSETHGGGAGFYFHLEPGASIVAGGIWMPPRPALAALRDGIVARQQEFEKTVSGATFRRRFKQLTEERLLTRLPRGFAAGHPAGRWLRFVSFTASAPLADDQVLGPRLVDRVERDFRTLVPLVRFLNSALGYRPAEHR